MHIRIGRSVSRVATCSTVLIAALGASACAAETGTLEKVKARGVITIGHRDASAPFSFLDEQKQPKGFAVDLCLKVVDEVKAVLNRPDVQVEYVVVNAQTRIPKVVDGTVDIECGTTTNTLGRQEQVDFSPVYFTTGTRLMTWKADKVAEIEDLTGKTIAVIGGSTNERAVRALTETGKVSNVRLLMVKDYADGAAAVEARTADAFATDDIVLFGLIGKSAKRQDLEVVGRYLTFDPYGLMLRRGDPDFRLAVNKALARAFRSGDAAALYGRWFDPIGVPLSPLLSAGFALQSTPE